MEIPDSYDIASEIPKDNHVVIFSHYKYQDGCQRTREGTHEDMNRLSEFFNYLQYTVHQYQDKTYAEIVKLLQYHSSPSHAPRGILILVVMTHGSNDGVLWAQDLPYKAHEIWEPFISCPLLKGKLKLFVFQACRGAQADRRFRTDAAPASEPLRLPHASGDVLLAYSTVEDRSSLRDEVHGSPYIQALCRELWAWPGGTVDLLTVLTRVTDRVVREELLPGKPEVGQTPVFRSYLDRLVINTQALPKSAQARQHEALNGTYGGPSTSRVMTSTDQAADWLQRTLSGDLVTDGQGEVTKEPEYPMAKGGCAVIYFDRQHLEHSRALQNVLRKCNFSVVNRNDISNDSSFIEHIKEEAASLNLGSHSCLLVAVLAPLNDDQVEVSGTSTRAVCSQFIASSCVELAHKPKIFLFVDRQRKKCCENHDGPSLTQDTLRLLTDHSDFLIVHGTGEDFLTEFSSQLQISIGDSGNLIQLLTNIFKKESQNGQHPNIESTLRRNIIFQPTGSEIVASPAQETERKNIGIKSNATSYQLPTPNFHGKNKEQEKFKEQLLRKKQHVIDIAVTGLPGVGKTELIRKCIYENEEILDEQVLWIHASTTTSISLAVQRLKTEYNIKGHGSTKKTMIDIYKKAKDCSKTATARKMAIVFDDVQNSDDITNLLPQDCNSNSFVVIVTSRKTAWKCDLKISIDYFTPKECYEFIEKNCALDKYDEIKLTKMLWNYPSELQAAVMVINERKKLPENEDSVNANIVTSLQQNISKEEKTNKVKIRPLDTLQSYLDAMDKEIGNLPHVGELANKVLKMIAIMDENKLPLGIFRRIFINNEELHNAFVELDKFSVIRYEKQYISSESLIRYLVRRKIQNAEDVIKDLLGMFKDDIDNNSIVNTLRTEEYCCYILNTFTFVVQNDQVFQDLLLIVLAAMNTNCAPHSLRLNFLKENMGNIETMLHTRDELEENYMLLIYQYISLLYNFDFFKKSLETCINVISSLPEALKNTHFTLQILSMKAKNLLALNELEESWILCLDIYSKGREYFGDDDEATREHLVNMCINAAKLDESRSEAKSAQRTWDEQENVDMHVIFYIYISFWKERLCRIEPLKLSIEAASVELKSLRKTASILYEKNYPWNVIKLCDGIIGSRIPDSFREHQHLLFLQYLRGRSVYSLQEPIETVCIWSYLLELYKMQVKVLGAQHEDTIETIVFMGVIAAWMKNNVKQSSNFLFLKWYTKNNDSWNTYLETWEQRCSHTKMTVEDLEALCNTMLKLYTDKRYLEVIEFWDFAIRRVPPHRSEHQYVLRMLHHKAQSLYMLFCNDTLEDAWSLWQDVYRRQVKVLGMEHEDTRDTIKMMAHTAAFRKKDIDTFFSLWNTKIPQQVTNDQLELLEEAIRSLCVSENGSTYPKKIDLAISMCDWTLSRIPDPLQEHELVSEILLLKSCCLNFQKKYEESWPLLQDLYWKQVRVLGMSHKDTIITFREMCRSAAQLDMNDIHHDAWKTYLSLFKQMLNEPSTDIETMMLGIEKYLINKTYKLQLYEIIYDVLKSSRGENHHLTLRTQLMIAACLCNMERADEAWQLYLKVCELSEKQPVDRDFYECISWIARTQMLEVIEQLSEILIKENEDINV